MLNRITIKFANSFHAFSGKCRQVCGQILHIWKFQMLVRIAVPLRQTQEVESRAFPKQNCYRRVPPNQAIQAANTIQLLQNIEQRAILSFNCRKSIYKYYVCKYFDTAAPPKHKKLNKNFFSLAINLKRVDIRKRMKTKDASKWFLLNKKDTNVPHWVEIT